jgi:osmoprotectant transport system permease protein
MDALTAALRDLPDLLSHHLRLTVSALLIGTGISLPLAVLLTRRPRLRYPALAVVSVIQTIPALALLALMVPTLAALSAVTAAVLGVPISAFGFWPALTALTLYSMLPILRNAVTGIAEVDPAMLEAARGVGMTRPQTLFRVELPLAAPVLVAGIRTATVWTVAMATLATPVGQRCLGNYIFGGLQTRNWTDVLVGCVSAAGLAILLDLLIGGIERAARERRPRLAAASGVALAAVAVLGLAAPALVPGPSLPVERADAPDGDTPRLDRPVRIGAKPFTEQYILSELIRRRLAAEGIPAETRESLGSTVAFDALSNGEIDCYVDYSGTIWANHMERREPAGSEMVLSLVSGWLAREHGITLLGPLGFENAYGLAMRRDRAEALPAGSIADLAPHASDLTAGGDYEIFDRPEWKSVLTTYGLAFRGEVEYDPTFMYEAVSRREVDLITAYTSDGRIAAFDLVVLDDPENAIPPYDAVLLLSEEAARRPAIVSALAPLVGGIDVESMRAANLLVDREEDRRTVEEAAAWLDGEVP